MTPRAYTYFYWQSIVETSLYSRNSVVQEGFQAAIIPLPDFAQPTPSFKFLFLSGFMAIRRDLKAMHVGGVERISGAGGVM